MSGQEVKELIYANGLKIWEVAYALGYHDSNFSRRLRLPFNDADVAKVKVAIAKIKAEKK